MGDALSRLARNRRMVMALVIKRSRIVSLFGASAITIWPFMLVAPNALLRRFLIAHEEVHGRHQMYFALGGAVAGAISGAVFGWPPDALSPLLVLLEAIVGYGAGHVLWRWLYLVGIPVGLPVGWNPFRAWTERAAYRAEGLSDASIDTILRDRPYYLWWRR